MITTFTLSETRARCVCAKLRCAGHRWHCRSLAHLLALMVLLLLSSIVRAAEELRAAVDAQRKALTDAVTRRDAEGVGRIFTSDAKFMAPGLETATGREAIQRLWQAGLSSGIVKGLAFAPTDLAGEGDGLLAETGTVTTLDRDGKAKDQSRYLLVWKREESEWRIHRDIVNSGVAAAPHSGPGRLSDRGQHQ